MRPYCYATLCADLLLLRDVALERRCELNQVDLRWGEVLRRTRCPDEEVPRRTRRPHEAGSRVALRTLPSPSLSHSFMSESSCPGLAPRFQLASAWEQGRGACREWEIRLCAAAAQRPRSSNQARVASTKRAAGAGRGCRARGRRSGVPPSSYAMLCYATLCYATLCYAIAPSSVRRATAAGRDPCPPEHSTAWHSEAWHRRHGTAQRSTAHAHAGRPSYVCCVARLAEGLRDRREVLVHLCEGGEHVRS